MSRRNWNLTLHRIYIKGREAFSKGVANDSNPYVKGERSGTGISSSGGNLQAQRRLYWHLGWNDAKKEIEENKE